jgi:hypothetical protein
MIRKRKLDHVVVEFAKIVAIFSQFEYPVVRWSILCIEKSNEVKKHPQTLRARIPCHFIDIISKN